MKLKTFIQLTFISAAICGAPLAQAQFAGYQTGDVTLVVWANTYDSINFDLGNVSQFDATASLTVSDFDASVVESDLGVSSLSGLSFNLSAGNTSTHIPYVTYTEPISVATTVDRNVTASGLNNYGGTVFAGNSGPNNYNIYAPSSTSAYDNTPSNEGDWGISYLSSGGSVYTTLPGTIGDGDTSGSASIDFYQVGVGTSTDLGDFTLNNDGVLTFSGVDAVPEPSTYALGGAGLLALAWRSRLNRKNLP